MHAARNAIFYSLHNVLIARDHAFSARRHNMISHMNFFIPDDSRRSITIPVEMYRIIMAIIPGDE